MITTVFSSNELDLLILQNGKDGVAADSKYTWVKYSQNEDGNPLTDDPTDAIYMGVAYNKEKSTESENPADYTWIKVLGNDGQDAYTIYLTNENITFGIGYDDNQAVSNQSFTSDVKVFQGVNERTDFNLGEVTSGDGLLVSKNGHTITISVGEGTNITSDTGYIRVPINIDGLVFFKDITWNTVHQGAPGQTGQGALNVILENESQMIPCDTTGVAVENVLLSIPFSAYQGFDRIPCTASVGVLPNGVTLGSNTPATAEASGEIILNVAKGATFGNASITTGKIVITLTANKQNVSKNFIWTKVKNGANGTTYSLDLSTVVLSKGYNNILSPSYIDIKAYQIQDNERVPYEGRFIISQKEFQSKYLTDETGNLLVNEKDQELFIPGNNSQDYANVYVSAQNESTYTYDLSSEFISGMIVYLCEADNISNVLDQQSVVVLTNIDDIKPVISQMQTTMSGVSTTVDEITKEIRDKVWQSDINTAINQYDNTSIKTIRDQQAEQVISLNEIESSVSDIKTELINKADGSTVQTLTEKVSTLEQDAEGFKQTVSETYATKDELSNTSQTLQSSIEQTSTEIKQTVTNLEGDVSTNTQNINSITQRVETAEGNITDLTQTSNEIALQVERKRDIFPSKVRYIRDWLGENNIDNEKCWAELQVIVNKSNSYGGETNIASGITPTSDLSLSNLKNYTDGKDYTYVSSTTTGMHYLQIDLSSKAFTTGYIVVKHAAFVNDRLVDNNSKSLIDEKGNRLVVNRSVSNRQYKHKLEVSDDGEKWFVLFDSEESGKYSEELGGRVYFINDGYAQTNMALLKVGLDGITQRVTDTEGNVSNLYQTATSLQTQITNNQGEISRLDQEAGQIKLTVSTAQDDIASVEEATDDIDSRLTDSESTLELLSDSISTLITNEDGESMMTQTEDGWTFNITSITDTLNETANNLDTLYGNVNGIDSTVNSLNSLINDITKKTAYINITTDSSGAPCIELGKTDDPFKVRITNTSVDFIDGTSRVAYISNNALYIEQAIIKNELQIGEGSGFIWKTRSNGNMGLRWVEQ